MPDIAKLERQLIDALIEWRENRLSSGRLEELVDEYLRLSEANGD